MDGAEYFVNPGDLPTCCTWIPMVELDIITMNGKRYVINKDNGDSIELI